MRKAVEEVAVQEDDIALANALGYVLHKRRVERGWLLKDLAKHTGLSESVLCRLEHAQRPLTVGRLVSLCSALDVSPQAVVAEAQAEAFPFGWRARGAGRSAQDEP
jgi:transcriptional regulator with XRE-family HTH domain